MLTQHVAAKSARSSARWLHSSLPDQYAQAQRPRPSKQPRPARTHDDDEPASDDLMKADLREKVMLARQVKRNEVGVQLLSRKLHAQIFQNPPLPKPPPAHVHLACEHLETHGLDTTRGSTLPDTSFTLPPLQGDDLAQHFHRIGVRAAHPWLGMAKSFAAAEVPPKPEHWSRQSGWTKYVYDKHGAEYHEHVEYPSHNGQPEQLLCFDVETMNSHHPYPVMACAASPNAWYAWISPWLLGETDDPEHLIPIGDPDVPRVIVGHNVSYDRQRIREEYHLKQTQNRFLDTMALHVAVKGISSHQRPAWMKHKKSKEKEALREQEARAVVEMLSEHALDLPSLENEHGEMGEGGAAENRWEDLTAANSLADVAKLHCGITVDKTIRNDFGTRTREEIEEDLEHYLTYCATDVDVTRRVYAKVLPDFMKSCPHPVSFAGILTMGSSFLPVNQEWETYLERAEGVYQRMEESVKKKLRELAEQAKRLANYDYMPNADGESEGNEPWKDDPWLSQLDWTPKVAGKSRGIVAQDVVAEPDLPEPASTTATATATSQTESSSPRTESVVNPTQLPAWYTQVLAGPLDHKTIERILPLLLRLSYASHPLHYTYKERWHFLLNSSPTRLPTSPLTKTNQVLYSRHAGVLLANGQMTSCDDELAKALCESKKPGDVEERVRALARRTVEEMAKRGEKEIEDDPWLRQLDWTLVPSDVVVSGPRSDLAHVPDPTSPSPQSPPIENEIAPKEIEGKRKPGRKPKAKPKPPKPKPVYWPKWYWEATKPKKDQPPGTLDITTRNRLAPLLFKLSWRGWPLFWSRQYGWTYRVASAVSSSSSSSSSVSVSPATSPPPSPSGARTRRGSKASSSPAGPKALSFHDAADDLLAESSLRGGYTFYKLPHKDGEDSNVATPLGKTFSKYLKDGTLKSPGEEAREALDVNVMCSYWISARDRILNQVVVWEKEGGGLGFGKTIMRKEKEKDKRAGRQQQQHAASTSLADGAMRDRQTKWGIIIPQVITMGTVTRRAIEKTWLTASNAKPNRVGSELKAMVRAPEGYAIVGADVDSEELWISSCMGDAQFGLHGATALGWMTLEGTKAAGTDLHSKTAGILGISRDQAKVFNYSRIYGAGMKHAVLLLLQANPGMAQKEAERLADELYASTKGKNTQRTDIFGRKFWFGGTESFVFNKLEEIAMWEKPKTPALDCGVTYALSREYLPEEFGADFMPSRINWVVQSSGVDYLHLLIVAMDHLIKRYGIKARYLISVHDELRYLVEEEDRYRAALALQIANLWTRCLFAYRLGMDDLPQGVAFFSAVDVDRVLRKEVDMTCVTPSQTEPIPPGESLDIGKILERTGGGSLMEDKSPMQVWVDAKGRSGGSEEVEGEMEGYVKPDCMAHRVKEAGFLAAQSTKDFDEVKGLAQKAYGRKFTGGIGKGPRRKKSSPGKGSSGTRGVQTRAAPIADSDYEYPIDDADFERLAEANP